jgi:hypothetical protein
MVSSRGRASACALRRSTPEAAAWRMSRPPAWRHGSLRHSSRVPSRCVGCSWAVFAIPGPPCPVTGACAGSGCLSAPSPGERPSRLRVLWADLPPSSASASRLAVGMAYRAGRPGPTRGAHVPGGSLPTHHALGGPRRTLGDLTGRGPAGLAAGALHPSPSAFSLVTRLSHASGRAVFPPVCGIPRVRCTCVVRRGSPSPRQPSGGVGGSTSRRRDVHPASKRHAALGARTLPLSGGG